MSMIGHNNPVVNLESLSSEERKELRQAILELNDSMTRTEAERDLQKEILSEVNGKIGVDKRLVRRLARVYFKSSFNTEVNENSTFEEFYNGILKESQ